MEKDQILRYLEDWNFWKIGPDTGIKRKSYLSKIMSSIKTKEIIVLSGVRRCGKSTLLMQLLDDIISKNDAKNTLIINLEDPRVAEISVKDLMQVYETYLEVLRPEKDHFVVIDEVQDVLHWEKFARYLSENKKVNVFITGSNSRFLSSEFSSALSGRYIEYRIMPLSFKEFLEFRDIIITDERDFVRKEGKIKLLFEEYAYFGGFPKIVLTQDEGEKRKLLTSYYETILLKDISLRYKLKETVKLRELSKFFLTNLSKIISINKIKTVLGVSLQTVQRFSSYLESSYLIYFVPKFDYSYKKQIANPKKIYAIDLGLRNNVAFQFSDDYGRVLENLVFLELIRGGKEVYYYNTSNNLEIDFAVKEKNKVRELIQVTASLEDFNVREREIKSLTKGLKELKLKEGLILTKEREEVINEKSLKIKVKPVWKWLLGI